MMYQATQVGTDQLSAGLEVVAPKQAKGNAEGCRPPVRVSILNRRLRAFTNSWVPLDRFPLSRSISICISVHLPDLHCFPFEKSILRRPKWFWAEPGPTPLYTGTMLGFLPTLLGRVARYTSA